MKRIIPELDHDLRALRDAPYGWRYKLQEKRRELLAKRVEWAAPYEKDYGCGPNRAALRLLPEVWV